MGAAQGLQALRCAPLGRCQVAGQLMSLRLGDVAQAEGLEPTFEVTQADMNF